MNAAWYIEHMALKRLDNVGIVVEDLEAAIDFFRELGLDLEGPIFFQCASPRASRFSSSRSNTSAYVM